MLHEETTTRPLLLGLDFDGTLAPLAPRPELAAMPARTRSLISALCGDGRVQIAVLSGRGLADLKAKVNVAGVHYAANHGLEIDSPLERWDHPTAAVLAADIKAVGRRLKEDLAGFRGVLVEDKGMTLSVHYRLAAPRHHAPVRARVAVALRPAEGRLRLSRGHMVWEVRPRVPWNKGHALLDLAARLPRPHALAFIGDDRTDEEGFKTLGDRCLSVRVNPQGRSHARFGLSGPEDLVRMLECFHRGPRPDPAPRPSLQ